MDDDIRRRRQTVSCEYPQSTIAQQTARGASSYCLLDTAEIISGTRGKYTKYLRGMHALLLLYSHRHTGEVNRDITVLVGRRENIGPMEQYYARRAIGRTPKNC